MKLKVRKVKKIEIPEKKDLMLTLRVNRVLMEWKRENPSDFDYIAQNFNEFYNFVKKYCEKYENEGLR